MEVLKNFTKNSLVKTLYLFAFSFALTPFFSSLCLLLFSLVALFHIKKTAPSTNDIKFIFFFSFLFFLYVVGLLWTNFLPRGLKLMVRISPIVFVPILIVLTQAYAKINYSKFKFIFSLGVFISCLTSIVYGLVRYFSYNDVKYLFYFDFASLFSLHPTYYSMYIITGVVFINVIKTKILFKILGYIVFLTSLILLQSKLGILFFMVLASYLVLSNFKRGQHWLVVIGIFFLAMLVLTALGYKENRINELFKVRNTLGIGNIEEDGISQRLWLWTTAIEHLKERPLTGFGLGSKEELFGWKVEKDILRTDYDFSFSRAIKVISSWNLHNNYLQICYEFGLMGLLAFTITIFGIIKMSISNKKRNFLIIYGIFLIVLLVEVAMNRQMGIYFYAYILPLLFLEPSKQSPV